MVRASSPKRELPKTIYGVTSEDVGDAQKVPLIRKSLERLRESGKQPVLRVVYQWSDSPTGGLQDLSEGIQQLRDVAFIMLEILDSESFRKCDVTCYTERSRELVTRLKDSVDIWEIGNEINERWLRKHPKAKDEATIRIESKEVSKKNDAAFEIIKNAGGRTALTFYYNDDGQRHCWTVRNDEMFLWIDTYVSRQIKEGLDYALISYYDDPSKDKGCRNDADEEPLRPNWINVFKSLDARFPNSFLGFGECGRNKNNKQEYIVHYYKDIARQNIHPRFIGGYFWWFFDKDMVPPDRKVNGVYLLEVLRTAIAGSP
jgi:hypothetical protein